MGVHPVPDRVRLLGELVALLATEMLPVKVPVVVGAKTTLKVAMVPDVKVSGKESPLVLKPVPVTAACDTVTLLVPVFESVTSRVPLLPTLTFPKPRLRGPAERRVVMPVPDNDIAPGELLLLVDKATLPLKVPVVEGAKTTLKTAFVPGARIRGKESPLVLKPAPVKVACDTVTLPVPAFVSVTSIVLLLPTLTFPKLRVRGLTERRRVTPVPDSDIWAGEFVASLTIWILPDAVPAAVGLKLTARVVLLPAAKVRGKESPLRLKLAPDSFTCEIVVLVVPVLLRVMV